MNGTPRSAHSPMGAQSPFSHGQMSSMTPMADGRSPHFVRGKVAPNGSKTTTAPDVCKLGEDLALRSSSANTELKGRLKAEQYGAL